MRDVAQARELGDVLVVAMHWGAEYYSDTPAPVRPARGFGAGAGRP